MRLLTGTSGFSYPEWSGSFYPEDLPPKERLHHYAGRLTAVEINNTFYRMPSPSLLQGWASKVPAAFRFALKAPQKITHVSRLKPESAPALAYFHDAASVLGPRLGPVLFQLPPNLKKDVPRLSAFLALLPAGQAAFEFRHPSWFDDEVFDRLRHGRAALCVAEAEGLATPLVPTASWGYLRLRLPDYDEEALRGWAEKIRGQPWQEVYAFFKHEDGAKGPVFAGRLAELFAT
jgi:uncharacterized protein YecE (DUF72 family)